VTREALPAAYKAPAWVYVLLITLSAAAYSVIVSTPWPAVLAMGLISSYGVIFVTRVFIDHKTPAAAFSPKTQSRAMLADGFLVVAFTIGAALKPNHALFWALTSYGLGWVVALSWHYLLDKLNYINEGAEALLYSPAKLGHDLVTFSVVGGASFYYDLPVLFSGTWMHSVAPWAMLVSLAGYGAGLVMDTVKPPKVWQLHDAYDYLRRQSVPGLQARLKHL